MSTVSTTDRHRSYLTQLTSLPTASGREQRVIAWVEAWVARQAGVTLGRDRFGNLMIAQPGHASRRPIVLTAHLDHPAFVVTAVGARHVQAVFRGGVADRFFPHAPVRLWHGDRRPVRGVVTRFVPAASRRSDPQVTVTFDRLVKAQVGDIVTWDLPPARVRGRRLQAPACDDLAAVAAALGALEQVYAQTGQRDVRLLLTRAEEVGFVGAIGACQSGILPKMARVITLENSKASEDAPLGAGPIVRVGDRTSVFEPALHDAIAHVAQALANRDPGFHWQRKLMVGGSCEATAFQAWGYQATCLCLPLGHYHNMNVGTGKIASEIIAISDYHQLIQLLTEVALGLDQAMKRPRLRTRLGELFDQRQHLLDETSHP